jgi:hypothetical protein
MLFDEAIPETNRVVYVAKQVIKKTFIPIETTRVVVVWAADTQ